MSTRKLLANLIGVLLAFFLASCAPQVITPSAADVQTAIAQTLSAKPTITAIPTQTTPVTLAPSPTAYASPTPTPVGPIKGTITVAFLNLRAGPSTMFDVVGTFPEGTVVFATARTAEGDWLEVEIEPEGQSPVTGWMTPEYLDLEQVIGGLPIAVITNAQVVRGRVQDTDGLPIPGIIIAAIYQAADLVLRADVTSDSQGEFVVYMPQTLVGTLDVQIVSWTCTSLIADPDCYLSGFIQIQGRSFIALPQDERVIFTYQATELTLTGVVQNSRKQPVIAITVFAIRDDGAISQGTTDENGEFIIPIAEGTWDVFAVTFNPRLEGKKVNIAITNTLPEPITLFAP